MRDTRMDNSQDKKTYCNAMSSPLVFEERSSNYLTCKFLTNSNLNYSTTRGANKIHLNRPNTNFYRSTFEFMGAQAYNRLPREIRDIISNVH